MQEETDQLTRRTFLKFSGVAATGLAARKLAAQSTDSTTQEALNTRSAPSNAIVIRSTDLELVLDGQDGLPYEYRLARGQRRMRGEDLGKPITARVCDKQSWNFSVQPVQVQKANTGKDQVDFFFSVADAGRTAASFTIRYVVE